MKKVIFLLSLFMLAACSEPSADEQIKHLNGYWEIKKAELPHGMVKEFPFSVAVDYIQVEDRSGFRKKVQPQITGRYLASENHENFEIKVENDSINLYYSTPYNEWKETIISSEENELVILNQRGIIYTYKRFTPLSGYGEEN